MIAASSVTWSCATSCAGRSTARSTRRQTAVQQLRPVLQAALPGIPASAGGPAPYAQLVARRWAAVRRRGRRRAAGHSRRDGRVANGRDRPASCSDVDVGRRPPAGADVCHRRLRIDGRRRPSQLARPLNGVDTILSNLRLVLFLLFAGGIGLAAALGRDRRRAACSPRLPRSRRRPSTSARPMTSTRPDPRPCRRRGRRSWRPTSTRCSTASRARAPRWTNRSAHSASWSPTPRTSCARRSPACVPTSRCCWRAASSTRRIAGGCSPTWSSRARS